MSKHLFIVTGSSRGLGLAVARQLASPGHHVVGIARRRSEALTAPDGASVEQWQQDLSQPEAAAERLEAWLDSLPGDRYASARLINNAATLSAPGPFEATAAGELSTAVRVGLEAPLLLTAAFLRATRGWAGARAVLLVSSGLGRRPMAGSAAYCAIKAGLDHFARALALDEALQPPGRGARVVSLAPGVIDTDMQIQLRGADPSGFPEQARFAALKRDGQLDSPEAAATKLIAYLLRADFGHQPVADVRDA